MNDKTEMGRLLVQVKKLKDMLREKEKIILEKDKQIKSLISTNDNNQMMLIESTNLNIAYQKMGIEFFGEIISE